MKIRKYIQNFIRFAVALVLAVMVGLPWQTVASTPVSAYTEGANLFDETSVIDDLGEAYVFKTSALGGYKPRLESFVEYSYSDNAFTRNASYGLYVYIYNPTRIEFTEDMSLNCIHMATTYNANGEPSEYELLPLKMCGYTTGKYDKLFYKFRVMGLEKVFANAVEQDESNGKRRYDVTEINLLPNDGTSFQHLLQDVSKTYYCSGYAQGCGKGAENASTLKVEIKELETIELEVKHANYRTGDYKDYVCDEINTVYFSVSENYFRDYGNLQKIKAEWYEYVTNPIFITSDNGAFDALLSYRNKDIGEHTSMDELAWRVLWEEGTATVVGPTGFKEPIQLFYKDYNGNVEELNHEDESKGWLLSPTAEHITRLDWLFLRAYNGDVNDYKVTREEVKEYMEQYTSAFANQDTISGTYYTAQEKIRGKYAEGLFADSIDADRIELLQNVQDKRGHIVQEIDAGDTQNLLIKKEQSWWDEFWHGTKYEEKGVDPIVVLTANDIAGLNADSFASKYYIGDTDKEQVFKDIKAMTDKGERAVLFRFAVTDYYLSRARYDKVGDRTGLFNSVIDMSDQDGWVAQETMFFDFTVISLTFRKESVDTVIPCVANPIDIINGIDTFPKDDGGGDKGCGDFSFLDLISGFLAVLVLLFVIWAVCKILRWVINIFRKG